MTPVLVPTATGTDVGKRLALVVSQDRVRRVMAARLLGWSERKIADEYHITRHHVRKIITAGSGDPLGRSHA